MSLFPESKEDRLVTRIRSIYSTDYSNPVL